MPLHLATQSHGVRVGSQSKKKKTIKHKNKIAEKKGKKKKVKNKTNNNKIHFKKLVLIKDGYEKGNKIVEEFNEQSPTKRLIKLTN